MVFPLNSKQCFFLCVGAAAVAEGSGAEAVMAGSSTPAEVEGKEAEVVEEDTVVSVSYMGHELDLETVGDIIAIIEEKVYAHKHIYNYLCIVVMMRLVGTSCSVKGTVHLKMTIVSSTPVRVSFS